MVMRMRHPEEQLSFACGKNSGLDEVSINDVIPRKFAPIARMNANALKVAKRLISKVPAQIFRGPFSPAEIVM